MEQHHEQKNFRIERRKLEDQLQQAIRHLEKKRGQQHQAVGFQPQVKRNEQWTVDRFWKVDCQQQQENIPDDQLGHSSRNTEPIYKEYFLME